LFLPQAVFCPNNWSSAVPPHAQLTRCAALLPSAPGAGHHAGASPPPKSLPDPNPLCSFPPTQVHSAEVRNEEAVCPPGTFYHIPSGTCIPCPPGTISSQPNSVVRTSLRTYTAQVVRPANVACLGGGTWQRCTLCAAGFAAAGVGNTRCAACPPDSFSAAPGSSSCTPCALGFCSSAGATRCTPCPN
jgi:hypothetical protein